MKEAIRMVPGSIYNPSFSDPPDCSSDRDFHSALRRIKSEWVSSPRLLLEFDIQHCFHTIDRHRLISIFKESIDDPKFFDASQRLFCWGRLVGGEKIPSSVSHSILLSVLPGKIYLEKLDQEIVRIREKHEIPLVQRIRSFLLFGSPGRIDVGKKRKRLDENTTRMARVEDGSLKSLLSWSASGISQSRVKSMQRKVTFYSLLSSWHTAHTSIARRRLDQKSFFVLPPSLTTRSFSGKPSSLLCVAFLIETVPPQVSFSRSSNEVNEVKDSPIHFSALCPYLFRKSFLRESLSIESRVSEVLRESWNKRRDLLIELGGEAVLVIRAERDPGCKLGPLNSQHLIDIYYARYADDLLLGISGAPKKLAIEIQKRITHFLESGLGFPLSLTKSTLKVAARSTVEFPGIIIRKVPTRTTPIQFLRELEKRIRVKKRIHITTCGLRSATYSKFRDLGKTIPLLTTTGSLRDAVILAETLGQVGGRKRVRSAQVNLFWAIAKHIRQASRERKISFLYSSGRNSKKGQEAVSRSRISLRTHARRKGKRNLGGRQFSIQIQAPIKKILKRLRDRGIISRRRPWPIHVACLTNVSDRDIINWYAGIAINPMSYYRYRDNFHQVRTIVNHQIRWSAIFTPAHKHKLSARNIILKYPKDSTHLS